MLFLVRTPREFPSIAALCSQSTSFSTSTSATAFCFRFQHSAHCENNYFNQSKHSITGSTLSPVCVAAASINSTECSR